MFHALKLMGQKKQSKGGGQDYARVLEFLRKHEALKDKVQEAYTEILPLVRKYSDEGRESAKVLMADMLMYRLGVEQDVKTAREMFGALAEGGNVYAQFVMIQGHLAPVAQAPAKPMLTPAQRVIQATESGNADAQFELGKMYKYGEGVEKDLQKARYWWEKATAQGHALARDALRSMN